MKKLNFVIFGALMLTCLATRALAETTIPWTKTGCESVKGTWITAHSPDEDGCDTNHCNELNFCQSTSTMNWWSAIIWCQSIGHKLADIETMCPNGLPSGTCANLKNTSAAGWSSTPSTSDKAYEYAENQIRGTNVWDVRTDSQSRRAFCME